jgi:hypothetical protein
MGVQLDRQLQQNEAQTMGLWHAIAGGRARGGRPGITAVFLVFLCAGFATVHTAHAKGWVRAETAHFVIYSDIGESQTREYLEQLEAFKYLAELMLGASPNSSTSSATFTIYLLESQEALRIVRPSFNRYIGGVYLHCHEGSLAFASRPMRWDAWQADSGLIILLHEYAHHLMYSRMQRFYPTWYVEGFADYMSTTTLRDRTYRVGGVHDHRAPYLTDQARWLDFGVILDPARFMEAAKKGEIESLQFYAQAWLLTHYMLFDSERTRGFNAYVERLGNGENAVESFESATGIRIDTLPKELRRHRRKMAGLQVTVPNLPEAAIKMTRLPSSQADYVLEAAVLQTCPGEEYGRELTERLRALRGKHADDPRFRLELARAELLFGDAQAARTELEVLAKMGESDAELLYLLGRSYYEAAQRDTEQREVLMSNAAERFVAAYKLRKLHPPTLYFLSLALDNDAAPSRSVINAANGAAVLAPSVFPYAIRAATINLRSDDRAMASRVMQPFASDPHNAAYAARVTAMIEAIRQDKGIDEIMSTIEDRPTTE